MKIFVAASYSSYVNYETGEVQSSYRQWLEENLMVIENSGYTVFCALREDGYKINDTDPATAFNIDLEHIKTSDALIAFLDEKISAGVQTEIGIAIGLEKQVVLVCSDKHVLSYFNNAIVEAGAASNIALPLTIESLQTTLSLNGN